MIHIARKTRNILIVILIAIIVFVALVIIFISPITKYLIEKYDVKYLGREITMDWIYVNPFTGYVHIHNLKLYEAGGMDTVFFSAKGASVNFAMFKLMAKTYEIENLTITKPYARIIQDHNLFNFSDMIDRFASKDTVKVSKPPLHFNILDIDIINGEFHYQESSIPVNYFIKNVNVSSPGKRWDVDSTMVKFALEAGPAPGKVKGEFHINLTTMEYRTVVQIEHYDLKFIQDYIHDFSNYGTFTASLDGDIKAKGNLTGKLAVQAMGWIAVNDFHFGKVPGEDYVAFKKLMISMIDVNPRQYSYYIDTIRVDKPFFKYERYDGMDNITALFGKNMQNIKDVKADDTKFNLVIEIGKYVNDIIKNFLKSYYKINRVGIYDGNIKFNDFSLREQFNAAADPLTLIADSIDKHHERMNINLTTGLKPYGDIHVGLSIDPNNYGTFDLKYKAEKIPLAVFNPYLLSFTSFPLDRGSLDFHGHLNVLDSNIKSDNHLIILDPRVGKRLKRNDTKWIPVPLIMSIVRERSGSIDYQVPIYGNLRDPKFKLKYVILDVLGNIFIKPAMSPYIFHVTDIEKKVERFLVLKWETRKFTLRYGQERFVNQIAKFMQETPDASIEITPQEFTDKEKEYILFFEAKRKFVLRNSPNKALTEADSINIDRMSIKDSDFVRFLNKLAGDTAMFTIQEKCKYYLGEAKVNAEFTQLMKDRRNTFLGFFQEDVRKRIKFAASQTIVPFNGFSYYKIEYKGEVPKKLQEAYDEINDLNDENPRSQYKKVRKKNGGVLPEAELPDKKK